uniref:WW domain-containing protein n=1 Tax=Hyaloperonospora arabidopsidis (strain Emoy2) TaxID=559515 RepID=M4BHP9_HYAAE
MTHSSPLSRPRDSNGSDHSSYVAKPRRARGSIDSTASSASGEGRSSSSSSVLRVSKEVENIGARVAISKKRVTWRFVLAGSEQVHTVMLEHSRISAKKRLKLDGKRLFTSEQYATNWHYDFHVGVDVLTPFRVIIRDVKTAVVDERRLETVYELVAEGVPWDQLAERMLLAAFRHQSTSVWSSDIYVRRVDETCGELLSDGDERPPGTLLTWTFAFGLNGNVHKLELRDLDKGEFVVVLDCRELKRVNFDDIQEDMWEFEYDLEDQHELDLVVTLVDEHKTYDFFIDGSAWSDIGQTDFVLKNGWYPVYSRSRCAVYFRHEGSGDTQWEKPIVDRGSSQASQRLQRTSLSSQTSNGLVQELHTVKGVIEDPLGERESAPQLVRMKHPLQPVQEVPEGPEAQEVTLIDFSDLPEQVQNSEKSGNVYDPFDPVTHTQLVNADQKRQPSQQPVDLLSL